MTPEGNLYHAVKNGDVSEAQKAIESGADFRLIRVDDKPLLRIAGELGRREICELLVREGADVNEVKGARRYSILHSAVACSDFGLASILLSLGADPNLKASNDATPLHFAARSGQGYLATNLINHGATINSQDSQGRTPLHWSVEKSDFGMVKLLLKQNCNVNVTDRQGRTPLSIRVHQGFEGDN